ncbi:DoxX family protein [Streptomyces dysideae]|uniref:DoxX family protein n=1 Tax=Streptomyces dysideae TaxID=909626 RepID=UPI00389B220A
MRGGFCRRRSLRIRAYRRRTHSLRRPGGAQAAGEHGFQKPSAYRSALAGLVVGLFWWPLGALAAIGAIGYFVGAVVAHLRVRGFDVVPSAVLLAVATASLALRLLSA